MNQYPLTERAINTSDRIHESKSMQIAIDVKDLPAEKLEEIKAYAKKLHKKFPQMKPYRLQRKVAEYFKIKLV